MELSGDPEQTGGMKTSAFTNLSPLPTLFHFSMHIFLRCLIHFSLRFIYSSTIINRDSFITGGNRVVIGEPVVQSQPVVTPLQLHFPSLNLHIQCLDFRIVGDSSFAVFAATIGDAANASVAAHLFEGRYERLANSEMSILFVQFRTGASVLDE